MIRIHGLPPRQLAALFSLMADNESFDRPEQRTQLTVIEGGRQTAPVHDRGQAAAQGRLCAVSR